MFDCPYSSIETCVVCFILYLCTGLTVPTAVLRLCRVFHIVSVCMFGCPYSSIETCVVCFILYLCSGLAVPTAVLRLCRVFHIVSVFRFGCPYSSIETVSCVSYCICVQVWLPLQQY